jgi:cholesterol transport system auxiliary component
VSRVASILVSALLCTGCVGSVFQSDAEPPDLYRLDPPSGNATAPALAQAISVARPRAASSLDTNRIAVVTPGHGFDYLAGARWADAAPQMVQQLLVDVLGGAGGFATAIASPSGVPADLLLDTELRHFEAVYAGDDSAPGVVVELQASLVDTRRGLRVASFDARAEVAAERNDRRAVIAAFEQATGRAVADVADRARAAAAASAR